LALFNGVPVADLVLSLRNFDGLPQDAYQVFWTVYSKDGLPVSGSRVPASKVGTGRYRAVLGCGLSDGCYYVEWEYSGFPGSHPSHLRQEFFVLQSSGCCSSVRCSGSAPASCSTFYCGQLLGPEDLVLSVTDDDGVPSQAFLVLFSIFGPCGEVVQQRTQALPSARLGQYYAPWIVSRPGNMSIKWEWMTDSDSPMSSSCSCFSASNSDLSTREGSVPNFRNCPPSPPPQLTVFKDCDGPVIPRTVVLVEQTLPAGGAFTSQSPFSIPPGIRQVSFYIKYAHGVSGGFPVVRLMWGNGTEETQSSIINGTFSSLGSAYASNQVRLNDLIGPTPSGDDPIFFMVESSVPGGSTTVRLLIAEGGVIGLPGVAEISLTGS
jgi:hypothetical protein